MGSCDELKGFGREDQGDAIGIVRVVVGDEEAEGLEAGERGLSEEEEVGGENIEVKVDLGDVNLVVEDGTEEGFERRVRSVSICDGGLPEERV